MKLTIVFDNVVYKKNIGLISDWGFSCFVETGKENILFDTGSKGNILLNNLNILGIDPKRVDKIIISHEHYDHNGGLLAILPYVNDVELYRLSDYNPENKFNLFTIDNSQKITDTIFSTGKLEGIIEEQSLVIKGEKGFYVLVGCSHPGIENILNSAKELGNVVGIIGGFHGFDNYSILEGLDLICPTHCTKHIKEIKKLYPDNYIEGGVGKVINI